MGKTKAGTYSKIIIFKKNILAYQQDFDKVCRSYRARPMNGTCGKTLVSKNAGKPCLTDFDCPTSD